MTATIHYIADRQSQEVQRRAIAAVAAQRKRLWERWTLEQVMAGGAA